MKKLKKWLKNLVNQIAYCFGYLPIQKEIRIVEVKYEPITLRINKRIPEFYTEHNTFLPNGLTRKDLVIKDMKNDLIKSVYDFIEVREKEINNSILLEVSLSLYSKADKDEKTSKQNRLPDERSSMEV